MPCTTGTPPQDAATRPFERAPCEHFLVRAFRGCRISHAGTLFLVVSCTSRVLHCVIRCRGGAMWSWFWRPPAPGTPNSLDTHRRVSLRPWRNARGSGAHRTVMHVRRDRGIPGLSLPELAARRRRTRPDGCGYAGATTGPGMEGKCCTRAEQQRLCLVLCTFRYLPFRYPLPRHGGRERRGKGREPFALPTARPRQDLQAGSPCKRVRPNRIARRRAWRRKGCAARMKCAVRTFGWALAWRFCPSGLGIF